MSGRKYEDVLADADRFGVGGHKVPVASKRSLLEDDPPHAFD